MRPWTVHPNWRGADDTSHSLYADLDGDSGREELIVVPLFGRGTSGPDFAETPVRILAYPIPADPVRGPWKPQVISEELHVAHNFLPTDLDHDGKLDLVVASFEGVSLPTSVRRLGPVGLEHSIGSGNQETRPSRGASEVKHGRLGLGRRLFGYDRTPGTGFQVVVYTRPESGHRKPGGRQAHAVAAASALTRS